MKTIVLISALALVSSCKSQYHKDRVATVKGMSTRIPVPAHNRDIGYDSIQLIVEEGKIYANFCYPNGLRFKKDTVYTDDAKYRLWGSKIKISEGLFIATSDLRSGFSIKNGVFDNIQDTAVFTLDDKFIITVKLIDRR